MLLIVKRGCPCSEKAQKALQSKNIPFALVQVSDSQLRNAGVDPYSNPSYGRAKKLLKVNTFPVLYNNAGKKIIGSDTIVEYVKRYSSKK